MWLSLLLPLLLSSPIDGKRTILRIPSGDALRFRCDAFLYRTFYEKGTCYYALTSNQTPDIFYAACPSRVEGGVPVLGRKRDEVLRAMHLDLSFFHDETSTGKKFLLCKKDSEITCEEGELALPGKCLIKSPVPLAWSQAEVFCRDRGASAVMVHNDDENAAVAGILGRKEAGWLLPSHNGKDKWSADDQTVNYWEWHFGMSTPNNLKCSNDEQHAVITKSGKDDCSAVGPWIVDDSTNTNIALCVKDAICPVCPKPEELETTTEETTTTTTTRKPTTTTTPPCFPRNDPPQQQDLWNMEYFYNWGRILHGFSVRITPGYNTMQWNGIGYDPWSGAGPMGGTINDAGYARLKEFCSDPEERKHVRQMWFTKWGVAYHHQFTPGEIYVGYVATKGGACGSVWPVRKWTCLLSPDVMYAGDLQGNTLYRDRTDWTVHFWLWNWDEGGRNAQRKGKDEKYCQSLIPTPPPTVCIPPKNDPPKQNDLWNLRYYFAFTRVLHAFAADDNGYTQIMNNGIAYSATEKSGSLGGTISEEGFKRLAEVCADPEERKSIKKMWFTRKGDAYVHNFEDSSDDARSVFVGYVSTKAGACGSKLPIKKYASLVSKDMMYGADLSSDSYYKGGEQDGGAIQFWLWDMNEKARDKMRKGAECS